MTRTDILNTIVEDVLLQIQARVNDETVDELNRCPAHTGNFDDDKNGCPIHYNLDLSWGWITKAIIYNKDGYPHKNLSEYLKKNFPVVYDEVEAMLMNADKEPEPTFGDLIDAAYARERDSRMYA